MNSTRYWSATTDDGKPRWRLIGKPTPLEIVYTRLFPEAGMDFSTPFGGDCLFRREYPALRGTYLFSSYQLQGKLAGSISEYADGSGG